MVIKVYQINILLVKLIEKQKTFLNNILVYNFHCNKNNQQVHFIIQRKVT